MANGGDPTKRPGRVRKRVQKPPQLDTEPLSPTIAGLGAAPDADLDSLPDFKRAI